MSATMLRCEEMTAKKQHHCIWCREPILAGERYKLIVVVGCDGFDAQKWHPECELASGKGLDCDDSFYPHDQKRGKTYDESHGYD
jgi:hypothetical protein